MKLTSHTTILDPNDGRHVLIHPASPQSVHLVVNANPNSPDGRSNWVWLRLPNGDLALATFPQGDTYFSVEEDAQYPESHLPDTLWCETCGERPTIVRTQHVGLCHVCAAKTIDELIDDLI